MTRNNNSNQNTSTTASTKKDPIPREDQAIILPDLSGLKDEEKQHILNVLLRDENLRNKHVARFMQLRNDINELQQKAKPTTRSKCARCDSSLGFIFNTGDTCPKCSEKVCKQCRLIDNGNEKGWICVWCYKYMQLLSYSGEWINFIQDNSRKVSVPTSVLVRKSLTPALSGPLDLNGISSSDTEGDDTTISANKIHSPAQKEISTPQNSNQRDSRMAVQTSTDQQKLSSIKKNIDNRPQDEPSKRSIFQSRDVSASNASPDDSSDDSVSLNDQSTNYTDRTSTSSIPMRLSDKQEEKKSSARNSTRSLAKTQDQTDEIDNNDINKRAIDCASVTSSEWGADSEKGEPSSGQSTTPKKFDARHSLATFKNLGGSYRNLRNSISSATKPSHLKSATSLEKSDAASVKLFDKEYKSSMYPTWSSG